MTKAHTAITPLILLLTGLLIFVSHAPAAAEPRAIPAADIAKPTMETLLQFDFVPPKWGMPEATTWTHLDFSITELDAGKSWDTSAGWYTSTDGPLLLSVLDGELIITPNGPSLVHRGDAGDQPLVENSAGTELTLAPGDGIVHSIHDAAIARNPGTEPVHVLIGLAGSEDFSVPGAYSFPVDANLGLFNYIDGMQPPTTANARVSIQQLVLNPYDTFAFHDVQDLRMIALAPTTGDLFWFDGAFDTVPVNAEDRRVTETTVFPSLIKGDYTMVDLGSEPVTLYFFVLEPGGASESGVSA